MAREEPVIADEVADDVPVERTLRQELEAAAEEANARHSGEEETSEPRQAREAPQQRQPAEPARAQPTDSRARGPDGKFLASQAQQAVAPEAPAEPEPQASAAPEAPAEPQAPQDPLTTAPSTWTAGAKAKWETIPPDIRQEILKREQDVQRGFSQLDSERSFGRELRQIVQPYEAILRASNMTPQAAIQSVLNTAYVLRTSDPVTKARTLMQVAKDYGVDLNLLSPQPGVAPQPQPFEPIVSGLQQRLDQQDARWQAWQTQQQQAAERSAADIYESFANNPANKYFAVPAVQTHMGALMQAGVCKSMDEAYKMACAAQPEVASRIAAENTAAAKAAEAKRLALDKARRKGTSVRGGPGGYTPPAPNMAASVRDDIMAAIEESNGRI
jgi:hypothetical protein